MTLRVFISYRRSDTGGKYLAHMIFRDLRRRYGDNSAFLDVDSRNPGLSFPEKVQRALDRSNATLVVIGPDWLAQLKQRESDDRDWVRYEVAESLKRDGLPVVPVCHASAELPSVRDLPAELRELVSRDGVSLDPFQDFDSHLSRLLEDLERVISEQAEQEPTASPLLNRKDKPSAVPSIGLVSSNATKLGNAKSKYSALVRQSEVRREITKTPQEIWIKYAEYAASHYKRFVAIAICSIVSAFALHFQWSSPARDMSAGPAALPQAATATPKAPSDSETRPQLVSQTAPVASGTTAVPSSGKQRDPCSGPFDERPIQCLNVK